MPGTRTFTRGNKTDFPSGSLRETSGQFRELRPLPRTTAIMARAMDEGVGSVNAREPAGVDAGDPAGIDSLWHTLHRDMRRRGIDAHVADDVAQETWLRIATRPPRMDRPLRPWLRVVGARVLAELMRKDRSR